MTATRTTHTAHVKHTHAHNTKSTLREGGKKGRKRQLKARGEKGRRSEVGASVVASSPRIQGKGKMKGGGKWSGARD